MKLPNRLFAMVIAVCSAHLLTFCSTPTQGKQEKINEITPTTAERFAPYAMMAANSYHNPTSEKFPVELLGWQQVDLQDNPTSRPTYSNLLGLAFDIYRLGITNKYAFVFRGTDSKGDYLWGSAVIGISPQYKSANKQFRRFRSAHPCASIVGVGHSLGGGLALSVSVRNGVDAITFDSSPRVFDGLGDRHLPALREMIYQNGEVLTQLRNVFTKFSEVVEDENIYKCDFRFPKKTSLHSIQVLAKEILRLGATRNAALLKVWKTLPQ